MLQVTIPSREWWDEKNEVFIYTKEQNLCLEHSLVSLSKWEAKYHKPFLTKETKTKQETIDYIRCMTTTQTVDPLVYVSLPNDIIQKIIAYIDDPMTATIVPDDSNPHKINREQVTAELIYYWMIQLNIPFECQKWHLNRLLMLIRVCSFKNQPRKKSSQGQLRSKFASINAKRRPKKG